MKKLIAIAVLFCWMAGNGLAGEMRTIALPNGLVTDVWDEHYDSAAMQKSAAKYPVIRSEEEKLRIELEEQVKHYRNMNPFPLPSEVKERERWLLGR